MTGRTTGAQTAQEALFEGAEVAPQVKGDARDVLRRAKKRAVLRNVWIPPIEDPERRASCEYDFRLFSETYLAPFFFNKWSNDHLEIIAGLQNVMLHGRRSIFVAPRGHGKSTLTVAACLWALLYGHRRFLVILCDIHEHSAARLESIRVNIETNDLLLADFPGPCACARALEGNYNRANGQTVDGDRTYIHWGGKQRLVFPTIAGEPSSGSVIAVKSMDKSVRGLNHTLVDGSMIRPDLALLDDPIGNDEARSEAIVAKREQKIMQEVIGLAGPDTAIACIYLGTIIVEHDLTSTVILKPEWRAQIYKLLYALPENEKLWDGYNDLRIQSFEEHEDVRLATDFYKANREAMDAGAVVGWPERFRPEMGEISAVQFAMDIFFEDEDVFWAEYQNDPRTQESGDLLVLEANRVQTKSSGLARGVIPDDALCLAAGWDVAKNYVHWVIGAVAPGRRVSIVDYGAVVVHAPDSNTRPGEAEYHALELALLAAFRELHDKLQDEPCRKESGEEMPVLFSLIDGRYLKQVVQTFTVEASPHYGLVMGRGTARHQPTWVRPPKGARVSRDGYVYTLAERDGTYTQIAHTDSYKQVIHAGFLLNTDEAGSIALLEREKRTAHLAFAHHIIAERQAEDAYGKIVWRMIKRRASNHWLDATCYMMAAFSLLEFRIPAIGVGVPTRGPFRPKPRQRRIVATLEL